MSDPEQSTADDRVSERADLLPEEQVAGNDDPADAAEAILDDSDARTLGRGSGTDDGVEHRTSAETTDQP